MTRRFGVGGRHGLLQNDEVSHAASITRSYPVPAGLVSPVESVTLGLDRWRAGEGVEVLRSELLDVLASVLDPRNPRGRRYPLAGLLAIAILATAAGMRGYAGFATWAATAPAEVLARLGIRFRRPSEKTFRRALSRLDPADLDRRLGAYFTTAGCDLRRRRLNHPHRHGSTNHGQHQKHRPQPPPPSRRRQHRRSLPHHRLQRQPRPRPAHQPPNQQITRVLINNAATLLRHYVLIRVADPRKRSGEQTS
jgi:hypothetical protein